MAIDQFSDAIREFEHDGETYKMADLTVLEEQGLCDLEKLPVSIRVLLESVLRNADGEMISAEDVENAASWEPDVPDVEVPLPALARRSSGSDRRSRSRGPRGAALGCGSRGQGALDRRTRSPMRPRDRPQRPGRLLRQRGRLRTERRTRVRAKRRAISCDQVGPAGLRGLQRCPAGNGDRPSGQPRAPGQGRPRTRGRR